MQVGISGRWVGSTVNMRSVVRLARVREPPSQSFDRVGSHWALMNDDPVLGDPNAVHDWNRVGVPFRVDTSDFARRVLR